VDNLRELLFLTQPAVTLLIKALEEDPGVHLFDRAVRVTLTKQGAIRLCYAHRIAAVVTEAEQKLLARQRSALGNPCSRSIDPPSR